MKTGTSLESFGLQLTCFALSIEHSYTTSPSAVWGYGL